MDLVELLSEAKWRTYYKVSNCLRYINPSAASGIQPDPYEVLAEMKRTQWMTPELLRERVLKRVRVIVKHAYDHVPYYNRLYRSPKLRTDELSTLDDFCKFPIVSKQDLRDAGQDILADNVDRTRLSVDTTAGSTGTPFSFYHDFDYLPRRLASKWLLDSYFGARPQTRYFRILNVPPQESKIKQGMTLKENLRTVLGLADPERDFGFSYLEMTEEKFADILQRLHRFKPKYGAANPTQLGLLSDLLSNVGMRLPQLKGMISGVETLLDSERKRFEASFGCPIYNRYGSREFFGAVAGECEHHSGLHVNLELVLVEIVDENGEACSTGEPGQIVITDFWNKSMPFIRYKIGDTGSLESDCACGRGFPMLGQLIGRQNEWVLNKDNRRIPLRGIIGTMLANHLIEDIRGFQFEQLTAGRVIVRVVPYARWNETFFGDKMIEIGRLNAIDFQIEVADELKKLPSGKRGLLVT